MNVSTRTSASSLVLLCLLSLTLGLHWRAITDSLAALPNDVGVLGTYLGGQQAVQLLHPLVENSYRREQLHRSEHGAQEATGSGSMSPVAEFFTSLMLGNCSKAAILLSTVPTLKRDTNRFLVGSCWQLRGDSTKAFDNWANTPGIDLHFIELGQQCGSIGRSDCQDSYYKAAARTLAHADLEIVRVLLDYFQATGQLTFQKVIERNVKEFVGQTPGVIAYAQASVLAAEGENQRALEYYDLAIKEYPTEMVIYRDAGQAAFASEQYALARSYWQQAAKFMPEYDTVYLMIAGSYRAQGDSEAALKWYEKAGNNWKSLANRAEIRFQQGLFAESLSLYERALRIRESAVLFYRAARSARALGDDDRARPLLESAIQLDPQVIEYRIALAEVCLRAHDRSCAIRQYDAILDLQPGNVEARVARKALTGK